MVRAFEGIKDVIGQLEKHLDTIIMVGQGHSRKNEETNEQSVCDVMDM